MMEDTYLGENIRMLRKAKKLTRAELAERVGISESHMNKIEAGSRRPGINTYQKIMDELGADWVIKDSDDTLKGRCIKKIEKIIWDSTDEQALFMTNVFESMSKNLDLVG
ncbi:hypothetical protein K040078D81_43950 [Blautia hominis]|uniref:HTH cro/C1-type domain-containing protein n=1 Tax=Blautia hominis TaxID=2025493 RepID=A0ABQ0BFQ1_9FIRM